MFLEIEYANRGVRHFPANEETSTGGQKNVPVR